MGIVESDVPLAKILEVYYTLREHPEEFANLFPEKTLEQIASLATENPFCFKRKEENCREETGEALITAAKAYEISLERGEKSGADYILELMMQGRENDTL